MAEQYYGLKTASGSWYLVMDKTYIIGKPTWSIYLDGGWLPISFLVKKDAINNKNLSTYLIGLDANPTQYANRGKTLISSLEISKIGDFIGCYIGASEFILTDFKQLHKLVEKGYCATSVIVETIEFKKQVKP
jgi:hypothetical protein